MSKRGKELGCDKAYERILAGIIFGELPAGGSVDEKGLALRTMVLWSGNSESVISPICHRLSQPRSRR